MSHDLVLRYFAACTAGDVAAVTACFTDDAVVYDLNHRPVVGADRIGSFYEKVRDRWAGAAWWVDTYVQQGDHAAIEWAMSGTGPEGPFVVRGSEHYRFAGGAIAEIRQYWRFDPDHPGGGLVGFPYETDDRFAVAAPDA